MNPAVRLRQELGDARTRGEDFADAGKTAVAHALEAAPFAAAWGSALEWSMPMFEDAYERRPGSGPALHEAWLAVALVDVVADEQRPHRRVLA